MTDHVTARGRRGTRYTRVALVAMLVVSFFVIVPPANAIPGPGTVDFELATSDAPEGTTPHSLNVVLDVGGPGDTLDIGFTVEVAVVAASPGTASGGTDYTYTSLPIRFNAVSYTHLRAHET